MSLHRFFTTAVLPASATESWVLPMSERDFRHLLLVLRLQPGDRVMLADPAGLVAQAVIRDVSGARITADVGSPVAAPPRPRVALAQGLARRERMEFVVQKCTELGVAEIVPVAFARSVVKLTEDRAGKRTERWRRIAEEAAKQSQRAEVPLVGEPVALAGLLEVTAVYDVVLIPWEESVGSATPLPGIGEALAAAEATSLSSVLVVIGPEGGFEPGEVSALVQAAGAIPVSLGETILRTETASVVAVTLASYELGALGGRARE
ncbi:MAG: 16S rRNA (uracil(1498)-N(3))-methyltransferase [Coriobacteriia bacterium]|nr:16S rRNA (uracil(1498)-N(3))-methyltransferase [Coriobacteriia bacterium]